MTLLRSIIHRYLHRKFMFNGQTKICLSCFRKDRPWQ